ncbi:NAD-dependent dihydropyrimidine dehydrogenase subunit PreT [Methylibium sp. T29]|nr:NAD-dependent dihydropyrimidine dehydrogenase subunit PreT [Methylibium sp. T29]
MNSAASSSDTAPSSCDVLVIGGGPAGSSIAALLAKQGRDVVLLEKAHHPRFHIGESLLPANVALFERLGVRDQVEKIGMPKWGIEFVSPEHEHRSYLEFADQWDKRQPMPGRCAAPSWMNCCSAMRRRPAPGPWKAAACAT